MPSPSLDEAPLTFEQLLSYAATHCADPRRFGGTSYVHRSLQERLHDRYEVAIGDAPLLGRYLEVAVPLLNGATPTRVDNLFLSGTLDAPAATAVEIKRLCRRTLRAESGPLQLAESAVHNDAVETLANAHVFFRSAGVPFTYLELLYAPLGARPLPTVLHNGVAGARSANGSTTTLGIFDVTDEVVAHATRYVWQPATPRSS